MNTNSSSSRRVVVQRRSDLCVKTCRYLYHNVHGRLLSIKYRKEVASMSDASLTFGEIVPQSFLQILNFTFDASKVTGRVFVDLGSGTGRACMCAALSPYGFSQVLGIELMPDLCDQSEAVRRRLLEIMDKPVTVKTTSSKGLNTSEAIPDIDRVALKILASDAAKNNSIPVDLFANLITKEMGHKAFKSIIKLQYKTFARYLKEKESLFTLSPDGKLVSLCVTDRSTESECSEENEWAAEMEKIIIAEGTSAEPIAPTAMQDAANAAADSTAAPANQDDNVYQLTVSDVALLTPLPTIQFHNGDMFAYDWWKDADVVYAASLLFSESMMETMTIQASWMKSGAWVISLKPLLLERNADQLRSSLVLRSESFYKMSWQMAKVYIYQVV